MSAARRTAVAFILFSGLVAPGAEAQTARLLGYQGRLLRADGTAATGTASVGFGFYGLETGGTALWSETQTLGLSDGYYSTFLGLVTPLPEGAFDGGARWLEIRVGSETLAPRQRVGAAPHALVAQSVSGGSADVTVLKVAGATVIDAGGRLAGGARYAAGQGIRVDEASQTVSLGTCGAGETFVFDGTAWRCTAAGTVVQVIASAPLSVAGGAAEPQLSIAQAGSNSAGFLSSTDWNSFGAKYGSSTACSGDLSGLLAAPVVQGLQSRPVSAAQPGVGQVLKWSGTASRWEPQPDADSGGTLRAVTAVAPLTAQGDAASVEVSLAPASASIDGYLSSADWSRFDAKYDASTSCGGDLVGSYLSPQVARIQGFPVASTQPAAAQVLRFDGSRWAPASLAISDVGGLSGGYVALTGEQAISGAKSFDAAPSFGTPLGVASGGIGTVAAAANAVFAGPTGGGAAAPGFRTLVAGDLPDLDAERIATGTLAVARGGLGTATAAANAVFAGPASGGSAAPAFRSLAADDVPGLDAAKIVGGTLAVSRGGTGVSAPFTPGSVIFAGTGGLYSQNNALLHWDDTAGRLGIGTVVPGYALDVQGGDVNVSGDVRAAGTLRGNLAGNVTGSLTGNVTGNLTGNVTGYLIMTDGAPSVAGAVRYFGGHFQGYDGTRWLNLDNVPPPILTSVSPAVGSTAGGLAITITGSNFQPLSGTTLVTIDSLACTGATVVSTTSITCTTPADPSSGPKDVKVVNPDYQSATMAGGFDYHKPPTILGFSATALLTTGGTPVTITGTDFVQTPAVKFGATAATSVTWTDSGHVTAVAPGGSGTVTITLTNPDGFSATGSLPYHPPPTISSVTPPVISTVGGMTVTINGADFISTPSVLFNSSPATSVSYVSSGQITAVAPALAAGSVNVKVTNSDTFNVTAAGPSVVVFIAASGGAVTTDASGYRVHTFNATGTFTPTGAGTVEALVVAGGGGGGRYGGGGGGGGVVYNASVSVTATAYTVTVGAGGTSWFGDAQSGGNAGSGGGSSFAGVSATGGGGGGNYGNNSCSAGLSGGSGGGGGCNNASGCGGGSGTSGQGNAGSAGLGVNPYKCGAGGGAGQAGQTNGQGGNGYQSSISGTASYYGGGGGAGGTYWGASGTNVGGSGGGGHGSRGGGTAMTAADIDGQANTGGGGGGNSDNSIAGTYRTGAGGSGVVIIRYHY